MLLIQAIKVKSVASAVIRQQFLSLRSSIDHGLISAKEGQAFARQIADDMKQLGRAQGEGAAEVQELHSRASRVMEHLIDVYHKHELSVEGDAFRKWKAGFTAWSTGKSARRPALNSDASEATAAGGAAAATSAEAPDGDGARDVHIELAQAGGPGDV